ncbi:hypothetical protein [Nocardioides limicola]|uniref:hypothetical protein n=1 Tax=Nocardioides limicola TaxID=2803368 RepID=UPI00193B83A6|nr:hypothetical protein [Nocardioides sp. DJM-14]
MTTPDRPPTRLAAADSRWWIKPAVIAVANVIAVVILVSVVVGWSAPVALVLLVGFACGTWWFVDQRPRPER